MREPTIVHLLNLQEECNLEASLANKTPISQEMITHEELLGDRVVFIGLEVTVTF